MTCHRVRIAHLNHHENNARFRGELECALVDARIEIHPEMVTSVARRLLRDYGSPLQGGADDDEPPARASSGSVGAAAPREVTFDGFCYMVDKLQCEPALLRDKADASKQRTAAARAAEKAYRFVTGGSGGDGRPQHGAASDAPPAPPAGPLATVVRRVRRESALITTTLYAKHIGFGAEQRFRAYVRRCDKLPWCLSAARLREWVESEVRGPRCDRPSSCATVARKEGKGLARNEKRPPCDSPPSRRRCARADSI